MLVAITDMEHQHRWTVNRAPVSFGVRAVQPDGMLVVGDHVMEGGPEGAARPLGQGPKKGLFCSIRGWVDLGFCDCRPLHAYGSGCGLSGQGRRGTVRG
jgi:hypothetical protein